MSRQEIGEELEDCAEKLDIDVARIQRLFDTPEAEQLFRENIKRALELRINVVTDDFGRQPAIPVRQLLRASGTPCQ